MRRLIAPGLVVGALLAAVPVLVLLDGRYRANAFRGYALVVGVLALRAVFRWVESQTTAPPPAPFRRRPPAPAPPPTRDDPADRLVRLAEHSAGDAHRGLRPALQTVADERLRARHGRTLADPRAADLVGPAAWELVRPDRPRPVDRRAPGMTPEQLDAVLTDLEAL